MTSEVAANLMGLVVWGTFWATFAVVWTILAWRVRGRGAIFARASAGVLLLSLAIEVTIWVGVLVGQGVGAVSDVAAGSTVLPLLVLGILGRGLTLVLLLLAVLVHVMSADRRPSHPA